MTKLDDIEESLEKPEIGGEDRDCFSVFFSEPPKTLLEFAGFVRDRYYRFAESGLEISVEILDKEDDEDEIHFVYHSLDHSGKPILFVIRPEGFPNGNLSRYGVSLCLEIARGEIRKREFNRFIDYLNRQT
ncbi:hypothetical protein J4462_02695 [Candidatus Pacearchaeota archaeon]|nr:hypothetical protein [Candidatus Pacearchaeota archaeon]